MTEEDFIEQVDCNFPYNDRAAAEATIAQGAAISPNAAFLVLHEICRPPVAVPSAELHQLLALWDAATEHPLKPRLLQAATAVIDHVALPKEWVLDTMATVEPYRLPTALTVVYFAGDAADAVAIDTEFRAIFDRWKQDSAEAPPASTTPPQ